VDIRNDNAILISPKYLKKWRNRWIQDNTPTAFNTYQNTTF
jgi:hypothetical protein